MTSSVENELKKTNENLRAMMNMQKMIIDALISKTKPSKEESRVFEEEDEYVSLEELKTELKGD